MRVAGTSQRRTGPFTRALLWLGRRETQKLTGRKTTTEMIEPAQAYAHAPGLLLGYGLFELAVAKANRVPERLKVLAELKAATLTRCEWCIDVGSPIAYRAGVGEAQLLALANHRASDRFSELEKLVLDYAVGMSSTPVSVSDELFATLREHLDDAQLVELTNVIAIENMRGRFNLALGIGSAGFSEGMVCAVPQRPPGSGADAVAAAR
ncbi:MAG TPA: carboxymuconolactone decarboxylase family protein [Solirubrobacteraceae bacterium]|jgi:AhpD family alkylhydroperoxidase|nr:carboxymuconolactone decarboxylase family protein [Solirubrobacteraceae bacterium]